MGPLMSAFLAGKKGASSGELERDLAAACLNARARWGDLAVADADFCRYLGERVPAESPTFTQLHVDDLYLACACANGTAAALRLFDEHFLSRVGLHLRRGCEPSRSWSTKRASFCARVCS